MAGVWGGTCDRHDVIITKNKQKEKKQGKNKNF